MSVKNNLFFTNMLNILISDAIINNIGFINIEHIEFSQIPYLLLFQTKRKIQKSYIYKNPIQCMCVFFYILFYVIQE